MRQKLKAPNENYEIAICRNCGKEYVRRLNNSTKQLAPGIRGWRMKNCSKKCTRMYKRGKTSNAENASLSVCSKCKRTIPKGETFIVGLGMPNEAICLTCDKQNTSQVKA